MYLYKIRSREQPCPVFVETIYSNLIKPVSWPVSYQANRALYRGAEKVTREVYFIYNSTFRCYQYESRV